eukprot:349751-Chlamydomonas_euryale.AAC.9
MANRFPFLQPHRWRDPHVLRDRHRAGLHARGPRVPQGQVEESAHSGGKAAPTVWHVAAPGGGRVAVPGGRLDAAGAGGCGEGVERVKRWETWQACSHRW